MVATVSETKSINWLDNRDFIIAIPSNIQEY